MDEWASAIKEGGALLLLGFVLFWVTQKLNGKLDRLGEAAKENTDAVRQLTDALHEHFRDRSERAA